MNLPIDLPVIILTLTTIVASILYLYEHNKKTKLESAGEKLLEDFRQKGLENFNQSIKKSQDIINSAEMERTKIVADAGMEISRTEEEYARKLAELTSMSEKAIQSSQQQVTDYMQGLRTRGTDFEKSANEIFEQRVNQMFGRLEERLADFLTSTEQKTTQSIELEVKAARNLIEGYKQQQLKLIDENIIAMMEQTLNIVLAKKLSLKDQLELVYEALEKAKIDKFVV